MTNLLNSSDILSQDNIVGLIGDIAKAHVRRYKKSSHIPMRSVEWSVDQRSAYISMPALSNELGLYIVKSATFFKRAPNEKLPAIISNVTAYDARTGNFLAVLDGNALTELKCAAISAYVSDFFLPHAANTCSIIGAGNQAKSQVMAMRAIRDFKEFRVYARSSDKYYEFLDKLQPRTEKFIYFSDMEGIEEGVDLLSTTTSSTEPLSNFPLLPNYVHVNCMGAHTPHSRELPNTILDTARLIVEDIPTAIAEAGVVHATAWSAESLEKVEKHTDKPLRSVFSSTGHAFYDLLAVHFVLHKLNIV